MTFTLEDTLPYLLVATKTLIIVVCIVFLISGLDDFFIDLCYFAERFVPRVGRSPDPVPLTEVHLPHTVEKPLAVMIPAWDESAVIASMLSHSLRSVNYSSVYFFVGTYPNDPATHREVDRVATEAPRVTRITCPHDGPTNKADCLNWIYYGIKEYERTHNLRFEIFVMQDCEDVIHPLCYKLFNYLIPGTDMVQLPVFSLVPRWWDFTAGHYLDEFAQAHYKDMPVRVMLDASIPSAGVGTGFSRRACEMLSRHNRGALFSIQSLTEDYEFGLSMKQHGLTQCFVKLPITRIVRTRGGIGKPDKVHRVREWVGVREYFPSRLPAAVRQKSRWVVGIVFQGWATLGWRGSWVHKYMLFRDRKALVTNVANMFGYLVVAVVLALWIANWQTSACPCYPPLIEPGTWTWYVILINSGLFIWRLVLRAYCVQRTHGWAQSALSVPRVVWGNIVNFAATVRALRLYLSHVRTGRMITWDKTAHHYPTETRI